MTIKGGDTVMCDGIRVYVEEVEDDLAYVFDQVNCNGGWTTLDLLHEITPECMLEDE